VRGVVRVAHDRGAPQAARGGVALVDRDRGRVESRYVEVPAVGRDRDRRRAEAALAHRRDEAELAALRVAPERGERVVLATGDVHRLPVGAHHHRHGAAEPAHARDAVAHHRDEAQRARRRVAREHRERVGVEARDVDVGSVGRERDVPGLVEPVDASHAVAHHAGRAQRARVGVAREDRHRVRTAARDVDLRPVGRDRDRARLVDPRYAGLSLAHGVGVDERPARGGAATYGHGSQQRSQAVCAGRDHERST
jgi:hypothetical protein